MSRDNGFSHQVVMGPQTTESDGSPLWPAASTEVWTDYVCPCPMFEKLGQLIFGGNLPEDRDHLAWSQDQLLARQLGTRTQHPERVRDLLAARDRTAIGLVA